MKKLLIGLTGRTGSNEIAGCGKDTVASIICRHLSIQSYGFADPIYDMVKAGEGKACWDCHRDIPHGGTNSLSSTPNALVPYPKSDTPEWLKKLLSEQ